jgi:hypothetical protein
MFRIQFALYKSRMSYRKEQVACVRAFVRACVRELQKGTSYVRSCARACVCVCVRLLITKARTYLGCPVARQHNDITNNHRRYELEQTITIYTPQPQGLSFRNATSRARGCKDLVQGPLTTRPLTITRPTPTSHPLTPYTPGQMRQN